MSPYETYETLPKGAYVGQLLEFNTPDRAAYIVARNGNLPIYGSARIRAGTTNGITHGNIDWHDEDPRNLRDPKAFRGSALLKTNTTNQIQVVLGYHVKQGSKRLDLDFRGPDPTNNPHYGRAVEENELAGGKLVVTTNRALSRGNHIDPQQSYYIVRNTKSEGDNRLTTVYLVDEIRERINKEGTLSITSNPYNGIKVINQTTRVFKPAGFNMCAIPANHYFLSLVRGYVYVINTNQGFISGEGQVMPSDQANGEGSIAFRGTGDADRTIVGHILNLDNAYVSGTQTWVYVDLL